MEDKDIGLRAQEFHEALKEIAPSGARDGHFKHTLLVGKAASLAMHLKGIPFVDDETALYYAAGELGITSGELPGVLRQLEHLDFVETIYRSKTDETIRRVEIKVPEFRNGYADLGRLWQEKNLSDAERAGVALLDTLLYKPIPESDLQEMGLSGQDVGIMKDIMKTGQLLSSGVVGGNSMLYSPLAVDNNPRAYLDWSTRYGDHVGKIMDTLATTPGMPLAAEELSAHKTVIQEAIAGGVFMPVRINGATGNRRFLFAPHGGLKTEQKVLLDKARALVACVRYGEHFASSDPVRYPYALLRYLKNHRTFSRGHHDLNSQYGLLVEKMIARVFADPKGGFNIEIYDTEENMQALSIAMEMVKSGDDSPVHIKTKVQQTLGGSKNYKGPTSERPHLVKEFTPSYETRSAILERMSQIMQGTGDV